MKQLFSSDLKPVTRAKSIRLREFEIVRSISESRSHKPRLYYLVLGKGYLKEKNIWEPTLAVQYLHKLISTIHKNHPKKRTATLPLIDTAPPMAKLIIKPKTEVTKQKYDRLAKTNAAKYIKKS